ncbi:protease inhibitor I42 family protein [Deinococcus sp. Leaf326]|jgi:membrane-bound inhibitor of C-type lysozyme/predicted secreted protein|uniref:protease inhibitor I42 family protein n=1 Tax=Deinococcus sp. Leaf326 TaxID=1736338 RepID=UPI0009ECC23E|nr:protease inhibitor I42 family protein [Deinococcus sp. Leaf326]
MNKTHFSSVILSAGLLLSACAPTLSAPAQLVTYRCDNDISLQAFYGNQNQVTLTLTNRMLTLPLTVSADGARYSDGARTWWTRGSQGNLQERGLTTAANCQDTAAPVPFPTPTQTVTLTPADAQRTTAVVVGSTITLRFPANLTTGYRYEIQPTLGQNVLKQTGSTQENGRSGLIGAPGTQTFTFQAASIGTGIITVVKRSPSGEITETLKFLIAVNYVGKV